MKTIRGKMLLMFGSSMIVLLIALGIIVFNQIRDTVVPMTEEMSMEIVDGRSEEIGMWVKGHIDMIEGYSHQHVFRSGDWDEIKPYINYLSDKVSEDYEILFFADLDGVYYTTQGVESDISHRDYFQDIINGGKKMAVSNPTISNSTGNPIFVIAHEVLGFNGQKIGMMAATVRLDTLSGIAEQVKVGDNGMGWIVDGTGLVIAHPDENLRMNLNVLESEEEGFSGLDEIGARMIQGESGVGRYSRYNGDSAIMIFDLIPNTPGWVLSVTVMESDLMDRVNSLIGTVSIVVFVILLITIAIILIISSMIAKPISAVADHLEVVATGDFTRDLPERYLKSKDEVGKLAKALYTMQNSIKALIGETISSSELVGTTSKKVSETVGIINDNAQNQAAASEEMAGSMDEMGANIEQVNENMQTMHMDADKMTKSIGEMDGAINENTRNLESIVESVRNITDLIDDISKSIDKDAQNAQYANEESHTTQKLAEEGKKALDKTVQQMDTVQSSMATLSKVINGLGDSAGQIGEIVSVIKDIAEQTNLLALNASIEAARAGEHGKGFAVVAQAIGNLADESAEATKDITNLIKGIQKEVTNAIDTTTEGTEIVESGINLVRDTNDSLDRIFEAVNKTADIIAGIAKSFKDQATGSGEIARTINKINDMIQELMASMEEQTASSSEIQTAVQSLNGFIEQIAASMEEQSAATEEVINAVGESAAGIERISQNSQDVSKSVEELERNAQDLLKIVSKFKIK